MATQVIMAWHETLCCGHLEEVVCGRESSTASVLSTGTSTLGNFENGIQDLYEHRTYHTRSAVAKNFRMQISIETRVQDLSKFSDD